MNMIPPIAVVDATLHSCSIAEPSATDTGLPSYQGAYSSGTTYSINAIVLVAATHKLYISLKNTNVDYTPGGAGNDSWWLEYRMTERWLAFDGKVTNQTVGPVTTETITLDVAPATDWGNGDLITGQSSGKTCVIVSKITALTYYIQSRNGNFTLDESIGVTGIAAKIADQGAAFPTITTANISLVIYELLPGVAIDSMSLHNIEAETVTVVLKDGLDGATLETWTKDTYDNAFDLYVSDIAKTNFLASTDPHFTITIANSLTTAKVGEIVIGNKENIGITQTTPSIGIIDYSIKEVDTFGNYTVLERAYSKRLTCSTVVYNTALDLTYNILAARRALPTVWIGSELYASMIVYGFYKDFSFVLSYPKMSICELEVEGLV